MNNTDPRGTDFIALADRQVDWTLYAFYHYSLEYWRAPAQGARSRAVNYKMGS